MAFLFQDPDEEQKKLGQPPAPTGGAGELLGSGGATPVSGQPGPAPAPLQSSSGWTNLRSYLDANKEQAAGLGQKVSENVAKQGEQVKSDIGNLQSGYETKLGAASPGNYQDLIARASGNPAAFAKTPEAASFSKVRQGLFDNPTAFELQPGYSDLAARAKSLSGLAGMTEAQQQQLIRDLNPDMGRGKIDLNQLILSGSPEAKKNVSDVAERYKNTGSSLDELMKTENEKAQKAKESQAAASKAVQEQFVAPQTQNLQTAQTAAAKKATDASAAQFAQNQAIKELQDYMEGKSKSLNPETAKQFGITTGGTASKETADKQVGTRLDQIAQSMGIPSGALSYKKEMISAALTGAPVPAQWADSVRAITNQLRQEVLRGDFNYNPVLEKRQNLPADYLTTMFSGTSPSKGTPTAATVTSPEDIAKYLALQKLTGEENPYFTEEDLAQAGTYRNPLLGKFNTAMNKNPGPPRFQG